jgi:flagellar protein FlaG
MNTDTVATISQIVPRRADSAKPAPAHRNTGVSPEVDGRQNIAVDGKNSPLQTTDTSKPPEKGNQLDSALQEINSYVQQVNRRIQFSPHEGLPLGRTVIRVVDADTDKVIREIPSEDILAMAQRISELYGESDNVEGLIITDSA